MKKLLSIILVFAFLAAFPAIVSSANAATNNKPNNTNNKSANKKPVKKPTPKNNKNKKKNGKVLGAFITPSFYVLCAMPDGKTIKAEKVLCDRVTAFWNSVKHSNNGHHSDGNSGGGNNNNNGNGNQPTPTPTEIPTPTPTPSTFTISGYVFLDDNGNGIREQGESGIPNYEVSSGYNQNHTITDSTGKYVLHNTPGFYLVSLTLPDNKYSMTRSNYVDVNLTQDITLDFGLKLIPLPMQIQKITVLPCTSSSCGGILTLVVEGVNFIDDAVVYLHTKDGINPPITFQDGDGKTFVVGREGSTKIISDFHNVPCSDYYANVYSPKNQLSGYPYYNIDLTPYICN